MLGIQILLVSTGAPMLSNSLNAAAGEQEQRSTNKSVRNPHDEQLVGCGEHR